MKILALVLGVVAVLLGGLWLVQGLGLVHIEPIACVAECETLEGPSPLWAGIGAVVVVAGVVAVWWGLRRRGPSS
jgi:hypothetical protein